MQKHKMRVMLKKLNKNNTFLICGGKLIGYTNLLLKSRLDRNDVPGLGFHGAKLRTADPDTCRRW